MKNTKLKSIVLSAVGAVIFASLSVGTTFALFTSNDSANVQVTSGKINVNAAVEDVKVYSAVFVDETEYHEELQTDYEEVAGLTHYLFSNGGYAAFDDENSLLIIDRITPGDQVKFSFDVGGDSNVAFKYRFSYTAVDTDNNPATPYLDLVKGMETTVKVGDEAGVTYKGLVKYQTAWTLMEAEAELDDVEFTLSLPVEAGNVYQNKDAKILVAFEAIQGNAHTEDEAEVELIEEDIVSEPAVAEAGVETVVSAASSTSDLTFEVTVPADAEHASGQISATDRLTIEVTDLGKTEEVYTTETSLNFDLTLKVNDEVVNDFTDPLDVRIYVGPGLIISAVNHNGTAVIDYTYDAENGYITFQTTSFSPFEVSFVSGVEVRTPAELFAALENGGKIGIKADLTLSAYMPITVDTTIIGFNHTITVNATYALRVSSSDVELNIGDLHLLGGLKCERGVQVDTSKVDVTINLDNVEVCNVTHYAINLCSNSEVELNINGSEITGYAAINAYGVGHHINVYNSLIAGVNPYSGTSNSFCTICLEGDSTYQTEDHCADYVIKLVSCRVTASSTGDQYECILGFNPNATNCSVEFANCTFEQGENCPFGYDISGMENNSIIINGENLDYPYGVYFDIN